MKSKRISKAQHIERMGERATRRVRDASRISMDYRDLAAMQKAREARRKNGVGRPPQKSPAAERLRASA
jgi:hypothetical protein